MDIIFLSFSGKVDEKKAPEADLTYVIFFLFCQTKC